MLKKIKDLALKDLFLTSFVIYCSGWFGLVFYLIISSFFVDGSYKSRMTGEMISDPSKIIEQIVFFGIVIFPLMTLLALINIKMSINKIEKRLVK